MNHTQHELSRDIDICWWQLERLADKLGLFATLERTFWRWRLTRLERRIPQTPTPKRKESDDESKNRI